MSSLRDAVIVFAGATTANPPFKDLKIVEVKQLVQGCGGEVVAKISDDVTHLVATPAQFLKPGVKLKEASNHPTIKVVDFEWLNKSLSSKARVDENSFLLDPMQGDADDLDLPSTPIPTRKRPRDASGDSIDSGSLKKSKLDGQTAKSGSINVPVDAQCPSPEKYKVYIDNDGMIYDCTLNQTNTGNNNNKFYRIQILVKGSEYTTFTRWGRVGNNGQTLMLGDGSLTSAIKAFRKKFKDKNGGEWEDRHTIRGPGSYNFLEMNYEDSSNEEDDDLPGAGRRRASRESNESTKSEEVESKLPGPVQRLMQLIFNRQFFDEALSSLEYDTDKMPLGKLSKRTLLKGYEVLKELAALVQDLTNPQAGTIWAEKVTNHSNTYFSLIPHVFGIRRAPILSDMKLIKREIELLETLTDMQLANEIMKSAKNDKDANDKANLLDRQYRGLGLQEMTPLNPKSTEVIEITEYLTRSVGVTHNVRYQVQDIFRVERNGENDRFRQSQYSKIKNSDRRLLWHGSRCTNFGGILSQGLRIAPPEAPASGYMFAKGIYLADMSSKSADYCVSHTSGNIGLLLLCEAELGNPPLKLTDADYQADEKAKVANRLSTWGVGRVAPTGWKDAGCIHTSLKGVSMPDVTNMPGPSNEDKAWLMYNEYIVYDVAQVRLRYLLRVEIK